MTAFINFGTRGHTKRYSASRSTPKRTRRPVDQPLKGQRQVRRTPLATASTKAFGICVAEGWHGVAKAEKEVSGEHRMAHAKRKRGLVTIEGVDM